MNVLTAMFISVGVFSGSFKSVRVLTVSLYNFQFYGYVIKDCGLCMLWLLLGSLLIII